MKTDHVYQNGQFTLTKIRGRLTQSEKIVPTTLMAKNHHFAARMISFEHGYKEETRTIGYRTDYTSEKEISSCISLTVQRPRENSILE